MIDPIPPHKIQEVLFDTVADTQRRALLLERDTLILYGAVLLIVSYIIWKETH